MLNTAKNIIDSAQKASRHSPWLMWGVTVSFVFFQFFLQLSAGVMIGQLTRDFNLTAFGAGMIASSFYIVYTLLQTPSGMLVDRVGPRRLLGGGGIVCALGCLCFALSHTVGYAFLGRLLMGAGASFAFVSSLYLVSQWFPEQRFAMMMGLAETIGMLGTLAGNVFLANLLAHMSWRTTMYIATVIAFILGIACYVIVRDKPAPENFPVDTPESNAEFIRDVKWIVRHPGLWLNGLYSGLLFCAVTVFAAFWALPFLRQVQNVTLPVATFESALIFVGIAIGSPLMGWLYRLISNKNRFLMYTALISAFISIWLIYFTPQSTKLGGTLFLLLGIILSSYVFNYSLANQVVPKNVRSTSIGFTNTLCVVTAPLLQPLVGFVLHAVSSTGDQYSTLDYRIGLSLVPICLLIAAAMARRLPTPQSSPPLPLPVPTEEGILSQFS